VTPEDWRRSETDAIATRDAYGQAIVELGAEHPDIVVLDADLSASTKTAAFAARFPDRFFNAGVAEANMIGMAAGLATTGKVPFASTFAVFATGRVYDQIRMTVAYPRLNVKIIASHGGITVGEDGASHQALEDIGLMRLLPGMTVIVPADARETTLATRAVYELNGPAYMRLGRPKVPALFDGDYRFEIGRARILRGGSDVAIIACGIMVSTALTAAEHLAGEGIAATVVNMSTIKPLDIRTCVEVARRCGAIVTAEEHSVIGGLGSVVAEAIVGTCPVPVVPVGTTDRFGVSGSPHALLREMGLTARDMASAARRAIVLAGR